MKLPSFLSQFEVVDFFADRLDAGRAAIFFSPAPWKMVIHVAMSGNGTTGQNEINYRGCAWSENHRKGISNASDKKKQGVKECHSALMAAIYIIKASKTMYLASSKLFGL